MLPAGSRLPSGPPGETNGQGAWAYFAQTTTITFFLLANTPVSVELAAGQWQQVGNPFPLGSAVVCGASASIFAYDPVAGAYSPATSPGATLKLGQGAWAYAPAGGTITFPAGTACPSS